MAQATRWLEACLEHHEECKRVSPRSSFVPTRLVEILNVGDKNVSIRLRQKTSIPADIRYATLSHRWNSQMPFVLTTNKLKSCLQSIPDEKISRVFSDAVKVAWRLDIRYVWIDSLCKCAARTDGCIVPSHMYKVSSRTLPMTGQQNPPEWV